MDGRSDNKAKIIIYTEWRREYSEDYRSGGWSTNSYTTYKCSHCNQSVGDTSQKFCGHCGYRFTGKRDERK